MVADLQEGLNNVFTDVTLNRGDITVRYGGDKGMTFKVEAPPGQKASRFQVCSYKKRGWWRIHRPQDGLR